MRAGHFPPRLIDRLPLGGRFRDAAGHEFARGGGGQQLLVPPRPPAVQPRVQPQRDRVAPRPGPRRLAAAPVDSVHLARLQLRLVAEQRLVKRLPPPTARLGHRPPHPRLVHAVLPHLPHRHLRPADHRLAVARHAALHHPRPNRRQPQRHDARRQPPPQPPEARQHQRRHRRPGDGDEAVAPRRLPRQPPRPHVQRVAPPRPGQQESQHQGHHADAEQAAQQPEGRQRVVDGRDRQRRRRQQRGGEADQDRRPRPRPAAGGELLRRPRQCLRLLGVRLARDLVLLRQVVFEGGGDLVHRAVAVVGRLAAHAAQDVLQRRADFDRRRVGRIGELQLSVSGGRRGSRAASSRRTAAGRSAGGTACSRASRRPPARRPTWRRRPAPG